jgi:hypothetical protein
MLKVYLGLTESCCEAASRKHGLARAAHCASHAAIPFPNSALAVRRTRASDTKKEILPIHPIQNEPVDRHREDAKHKWLQSCAKYLKDPGAKMDMQAI